jgi:hypothetical protein
MNTVLDLTIRCRYNRKLTRAEEALARQKLTLAAEHLADAGLLTGEEAELELASWKQSVKRASTRRHPHRS